MTDLRIIREDLRDAEAEEKRLLNALQAVRSRIVELKDEFIAETNQGIGLPLDHPHNNGYRRKP